MDLRWIQGAISMCCRSNSFSSIIGENRAQNGVELVGLYNNIFDFGESVNYKNCRNFSSYHKRDQRKYRKQTSKLEAEEDFNDEDSSEEEFETSATKLKGRDNKSDRSNNNKEKSDRQDNHHSQKDGKGQVRPTRYLFKDLQGSDQEERRWVTRGPRPVGSRRRVEWYANQMLKLTNQNQVGQAQEMLQSMKDEKIKPSPEVFNILISAYTRAGQPRKAFHHYNQIKKMGLKPTSYTYTSLFSCYAASANTSHSLEQVGKLWAELQGRINTEDIEPHLITYNAAIKAFAACGNPVVAFEVYEDMLVNHIQPDSYTSAALLNACALMGTGGPTKALWVLQEMKEHDVKPDIYVFNLLLRVIRDAKTAELKNKFLTSNDQNFDDKSKDNTFGGDSFEETSKTQGSGSDLKSNLASTTEALPKTEHTFQDLFTGVENFLQLMAINDSTPDIRTFHLMLQISWKDDDQEKLILKLMKDCNVTPDVAVLNTLVKRKALSGDMTSAEEYISTFHTKYSVRANENTYECLASGCSTRDDGFWLLNEMKQLGMPPKSSLFIKLISNAARREDYPYLTDLLKKLRNDGVQPLDDIIILLDKVSNRTRRHVFKPGNASTKTKRSIEFVQKQHQGFGGFYNKWKREITGNNKDPKIDEHDYDDDDDDTEDINYDHL